MNILATQYTLSTKSFEIYVSGCAANPHCFNCHNPESWDFNNGDKFTQKMLLNWVNKIKDFNNIIDNVMIFGGEPLDNNIEELNSIIEILSKLKPVWVFTRYSIENAKVILGSYINNISYLKCGAYIEELKCDNNVQYGIKLATENQNIYKRGVDF